MMVDSIQSDVQLAAQVSANDAAIREEQDRRAHAERMLDEQIAAVSANSGLSFEEKQRLIGQLNSARGQSVQAMTIAIQLVISETPAAVATTSYEMLSNAAVAQEYAELSEEGRSRVNARCHVVDLNNAQQVHTYAAAWANDKGLPPALRENDIKHVEHYLTQTAEGREAVAIMNAHPAETKKVLTQEEHAKEQLEKLEKLHGSNSPEGKAVHTALQHHLYAKAEVAAQVEAAAKDPEVMKKLMPAIEKGEADYQHFVHTKPPVAPTASEAAITQQHPQAKLTNDQSLDRYAQLEHDAKRMDVALKAANDLLAHPEHTKNYPEETIKDAVSWSTHHEDAVEFAIKETSKAVLDGVGKAKSQGLKLDDRQMAISEYAGTAGKISIGIDDRAQSLDQIAITSNTFLQQISNDKQGRIEIHHASEAIIKSKSLEASFHTASQTFLDGAKAILDGNTQASDQKAHDVGLGVKNIAKSVVGEDAAQALGHTASTILTGAGHGGIATINASKTVATATVNATNAAIANTKDALHTVTNATGKATDAAISTAKDLGTKTADALSHGASAVADFLLPSAKAATPPVVPHPVATPAAKHTPTALEEAAHPAGAAAATSTPAATKAADSAATKRLNEMSALEAKLGLNVDKATLADVAKALSDKGIKIDPNHETAADLINASQSLAGQNLPNAKPPVSKAAASAPAH